MALIKPDFNEVADTVAAGTYKARIVDAKFGEYKTGTKYVNWTMETYGEEMDKNNGRRIYYKTPIHGPGAKMLKTFFRAAMKQDLASDFDTDMLLGKELEVSVVDGMDQQGNPTGYADVKTVKPI